MCYPTGVTEGIRTLYERDHDPPPHQSASVTVLQAGVEPAPPAWKAGIIAARPLKRALGRIRTAVASVPRRCPAVERQGRASQCEESNPDRPSTKRASCRWTTLAREAAARVELASTRFAGGTPTVENAATSERKDRESNPGGCYPDALAGRCLCRQADPSLSLDSRARTCGLPLPGRALSLLSYIQSRTPTETRTRFPTLRTSRPTHGRQGLGLTWQDSNLQRLG